MSDYKPITGELRSMMFNTESEQGTPMVELGKYRFTQLCDAIDAIHAQLERENAALKAELDRVLGEQEEAEHRGWTRGYDEGFANADDVLWVFEEYGVLEEHGWVRLPVDGEAPCKQLGEWIEKRGLITGPLDHDGKLWHKGDMSASPWGEIGGIVFDGECWKICGHDTSAPWLPANSLLHYHAPTVEDVLREFALKVAGEECMTMRTGVVEEYAAKLRLAKEEDA